MIRHRVRWLAAALALWGTAALAVGSGGEFFAPAQRAARLFERAHPLRQTAIRVGERLVFSVRYGPVRAGTATMSVLGTTWVEGDSCYHLTTTAESNDFFSSFFQVRDRVESFVGVDDLLPRRFEKHLREGNYAADDTVRFDQRQHMAIYADGRIFEILPDTHDVLSAFYDARTRELRPGASVNLDCHADRKNYPLKTQVHRRERVSVPAGDFDCLVIEPMLRTPGLFRNEGSLTIWLTDDARRIPVQMKSKLPIGSVSVVLTGIEERPTAGGTP
jgi:hypothetical protein